MVGLARTHGLVVDAHFDCVFVVALMEAKVVYLTHRTIVALEAKMANRDWQRVTVH